MWNLKCDTTEPIYEMETESWTQNRPVVVKAEGAQWRRDRLGAWD